MRVLSFNVLCYGNPTHFWLNRIPGVIKVIKYASPDSFGVQEAHKKWMDVLCENLPEYGYVGVGREDGADEGEFAAVFYKKSLYEVTDSGNFWLSETPDKPSLGWDSACIRICTWAELKNKENGKTYIHMNTHLDHIGVTARSQGVKLIKEKAASFGGKPVICTGDFNIEQDTDCYIEMVSGNMGDARKLAPDSDDCYTFHGFRPSKIQNIIDFIFIDKNTVKPLKFKVINKKEYRKFYSDHYAVYLDLEI
ncbi:MAG: endonuclease/exonuclease/phosphatase family protein [Clostridia bacterium]|nr:endonuclease/exonuclease/phosphatase family protein [Clostridia bacterium]